ncbi:UNVERIFIED_CONTAM: hypothetical protein Slati_0812900 [Sesamum latifolium]|uniref:Uncharacterized protein n=1 Tax=Sesamum latifolium TaxID=2727402 RepID=A0AAW2XKM7_9LAMI
MSVLLRCLGTIAHQVLGTSHPWGCEEWTLRPFLCGQLSAYEIRTTVFDRAELWDEVVDDGASRGKMARFKNQRA